MRVVWVGLVGAGCGDSLIGGFELDERIGVTSPPDQAAWEVRWVGPSGLRVACERVAAGEARPAQPGSIVVEAPALTAPEAAQQDAGAYRWALALPVYVEAGAQFPPAGDEGSLQTDLGVWGTTAPLAWLALEGDRAAAAVDLRVDHAGSLPAASWVEIVANRVGASFAGSMWPTERGSLDEGMFVQALAASDDEELDLGAGDSVGGIAATCGGW